ncbi:YndJ family protein [Ectobacillus antri]|jgi:hypothetical protein|uniref:YndJ family protein n=1 Tax=Ectobacillus antri TaxID=2486280 RepID=A0ABT6H0T6_9BACI|nr:YndJ family protein [Ectobacillus antri]MDG4656324.1 YndJ family protein [Ectobacillus antri]MDG5752999.1 YndJ family protein [Ectobacillus antri]
MKYNIIFGALVYIIYMVTEGLDVYAVEALVLLSICVFVPSILTLVDSKMRNGRMFSVFKILILSYPIAVISAALAFVTNMPVFASIWFGYTIMVGYFGVHRLIQRGIRPLQEFAIDIGLLYLVLGGFWFYAYIANIQVMHFTSIIVLLTAIHFHYSALLIPIFTGFLGRKFHTSSNLYTYTAWSVIVSPMTIAVGITYSRVFEFIAVLAYMFGLYMYSIMVLRTPFQRNVAKVLVSISALVLIFTISLSLLYAYGRAMHQVTISIDAMIFFHGLMNTIGVVTPAIIGWFLEGTKPRYVHYGKPCSRITGTSRVGTSFLSRRNLLSSDAYDGLVDDMRIYKSAHLLSPTITDFYERTETYSLQARVQWSTWFKPLGMVYEQTSKYIGQIYLKDTGRWEEMYGKIVGIRSAADGRDNVRAWLRSNEKGEAIFIALYAQHTFQGETYMNVALPLPFSNMTGILRLYNDEQRLILTSRLRTDGQGDEGTYLYIKYMTVRLPIDETFVVIAEDDMRLSAQHDMHICGIRFLTVNYRIMKNKEAEYK